MFTNLKKIFSDNLLSYDLSALNIVIIYWPIILETFTLLPIKKNIQLVYNMPAKFQTSLILF